ncbi:MAG: outer membrane protein assembly factor BamD [Myxococcota bacterium]
MLVRPLRTTLRTWGLAAAFFAAALATSACASDGMSLDGRPVEKDGETPAATARRAYLRGMEELVAGNNNQAVKIFSTVARSPRYIRHAALAKIRIGDAYYNDRRFEESAEAYRSFIAQHGSDPNIPYARFRVASCYYQRVPSGLFIEPPDFERDQTATRSAVRELRRFIAAFPTSQFSTEARTMLIGAQEMLLAHQIYVADFYESRDKPRAVAWRLKHALETYPAAAKTPALVWRMASAYDTAEEQADAAQAYAMYITSFPDGPHILEAKARLEDIRKAVTPPKTESSE